ncbi:hypothetical protein KVV02_003044 [Mortierella alpina]|uniref:Uncharacterized protein n=1 Tax=Mortierella alpina TaxID=64518 RepID=A0A9P8A1A7_MORAP|nr:hypothetical protein KVV02_003044 [Mortierella alpina]
MASTAAARSQSLSQFRRILREVHLQYTHPNERTATGLLGVNVHENKVWTEALKDAFRKNAGETDPVKLSKLHTDGEDLAVYMESQRSHQGLVERYNPSFWDEEKGLQVGKTATMVGFEMPKEFNESQKDEQLVAPPRFTYTNKKDQPGASTAETAAQEYQELESPAEPKKRTYMIPKAFGFAEQAEEDLGRPGDRKFK